MNDGVVYVWRGNHVLELSYVSELESPEQRAAFLEVARELAGELVITDSALRPGGQEEAWDERVLNDGSRHRVYKRWFTASDLARELGGGVTVHDGPWFVSVRLSLRS